MPRMAFASLLYEGQLDDADLLEEIEQSCWALAEDDRAGRSDGRPASGH
jgi:hypothetical protein